MKGRFDFILTDFRKKTFFEPIRGKSDAVIQLIRATKFMTIYTGAEKEGTAARLVLNVDKMSRLFFIDEKKVFSIQFPFVVKVVEAKDGEGGISFYSKDGYYIDQKMTSDLISLFNNDDGLINEEELADVLYDPVAEKSGLSSVLKALLSYESGYIRYDYDEEREQGKLHPRNHLDIFYSQASTFKIGLNDGIHSDVFIDILDTGTDCHFLKNK